MALRAAIFGLIASLFATVPALAQAPDCALRDFSHTWPSTLQTRVVRAENDRVAILYGVIGPQDIAIPRGVTEVWMHSPGGDYAAAARLAAVLRQARVRVRVPRGWVCGDACAIVFAANPQGRADPGSLLYLTPIRRALREADMNPPVSVDAEGAARIKTAWGAEAEAAAAAIDALGPLRFGGVRRALIPQSVSRARGQASVPVVFEALTSVPGFVCTTGGDEQWRLGVREDFIVRSLSGRYPPPGAQQAFAAGAPRLSAAELAQQWPRVRGNLVANERRNNGLNQQFETAAIDLFREAAAQAQAAKAPTTPDETEASNAFINMLTEMNSMITNEYFRITLMNQPIASDPYMSSVKHGMEAALAQARAAHSGGLVARSGDITTLLAAARTREDLDGATQASLGLGIASFCPDMAPFDPGGRRPSAGPTANLPQSIANAVEARCSELRRRERYSARERSLMNAAGRITAPASYSAPGADEIMRVYFRELMGATTAKMVDINVAHQAGANEFARDMNTSLNFAGMSGGFGGGDINAPGMLITVRGVEVKSCTRASAGGYTCAYAISLNIRPNAALASLDRLGMYSGLFRAMNERMPVQTSNRFVLTSEGWRSPDMAAAMSDARVRAGQSFYDGLGHSAQSTIRTFCAMREAANDVWVATDPNCRD